MKSAALAVLLLAGAAAAEPDGGTPATPCALDVEVNGAREGGVVWVLVFSDAQAAAYPTKRKEALARVDVESKAKGGVVRVSFEALECRDYAVAVVHDENGNGKLDTGLFGIPREGLGASRNARRLFGPPKFDDAKITATPGRTKIPLSIVY